MTEADRSKGQSRGDKLRFWANVVDKLCNELNGPTVVGPCELVSAGRKRCRSGARSRMCEPCSLHHKACELARLLHERRTFEAEMEAEAAS